MPTPTAPLGTPTGAAIKPIPALSLVDGSRPAEARPRPVPAQQPALPNLQGQPPVTRALKPSAVAQVAAEKGDPSAWILNLFKPAPKGQPGVPIKQGCALTEMAVNTIKRSNVGSLLAPRLRKPPVQTPVTGTTPARVPAGVTVPQELGKRAAALGPVEPNRGRQSDPERAPPKGPADGSDKRADTKPANCTCPNYPRWKIRNGSGHHTDCPCHKEWRRRFESKR